MTRRHPRARPPSPYATIPRGLSWYQEVAEYRRGTPTIGVMPEEKMMQILWCKDLGEGQFERGSGAPCKRCGCPAWMHWTVKP